MKSYVLNTVSTPGRTIVMNQSGRVTTPTGNQKIVFLAQRPQTPSNVQQQNQPNNSNQQNTVVKFVSNTNNANSQKLATTQQKLVVVCMPSSSPNNITTVNTQSTSNTLPGISQGNPQSLNMVSKPNFMQQQQQQQKIKVEAMDIEEDVSAHFVIKD
ncbi:hypothetical protein Trydic_g9 [Trypoxylus dichotomus]